MAQQPVLRPQLDDLTEQQAPLMQAGSAAMTPGGWPAYMFPGAFGGGGSMGGDGSAGGPYAGGSYGGGYGGGGYAGDVSSFYQLPGAAALWPGTYWYYRMMLRHPTVQLARTFAIAPILQAGWSIEADKDAPGEAQELANKMLLPLRLKFLRDACRAVDFGWAPLAPVWQVADGLLTVRKIKPLLHELTRIDVTRDTGDFAGFHNGRAALPRENSLLITYDEESGNLYGRGRLENLRRCVADYADLSDSFSRYIHKIAGVFFVMHYPGGSSRDAKGNEIPNWQVAQRYLDNLCAGRGIALPNEFAGTTNADGQISMQDVPPGAQTRWRVELLEDKGGAEVHFVKGLEYFDSLIFRGYHVSERSGLESRRGGLGHANAEKQQDMAMISAELTHQEIVQTCNTDLLDTWLQFNYGRAARGKLQVRVLPLTDDKREFRQELVKALLSDRKTALNLLSPGDIKGSGLDLVEDADDQLAALREVANQPPEEQPEGLAVRRVAASELSREVVESVQRAARETLQRRT